jgi:hypothetical protein
MAVLLAGCATSQVQWNTVKLREQVMDYYNDEIMENLIRANNHLPFVHVDIQTLTSQGSSSITDTVSGGETRTNTNASTTSISGIVGTITRAVTRPLTYSVAPTRSETLSITAAPALGSQALASPPPAPSSTASPSASPKPTPDLVINKVTEIAEPPGTITETKTEKTVKPPKIETITLYELYEKFAKDHLRNTDGLTHPREDYVPGTLKRWGNKYYYTPDDKEKKTRSRITTFAKRCLPRARPLLWKRSCS